MVNYINMILNTTIINNIINIDFDLQIFEGFYIGINS